jgi:ribosomal protein S18 acetylase RimI-like enzyme
MSQSVEIRAALPADAEEVSRCVSAAYSMYITRLGKPPAPMLESYRDVIAQRPVFVVTERLNVIGVLVLGNDDEGLLLENVAVDPRHQGKGVGRALLRFAEAEARRQGVPDIHLYTNVVMTENQLLYSKIGYVEYASREEDGFSRV